ncbi:MAG TPA: hypothetical protein VGB52_01400 [Actinomycetota bacterium]
MKADPQIHTLLERAASTVRTDPERALDEVLRAPQRSRQARPLLAIAATVAILAVLVVVAVLVWPGTTDRGFVQEGSEPTGTLAIGRRTDPSGTEQGSGLYAYGFAEQVPVPIATGAGNITAAQWSPDGTRIAYTVEQDEGASYALVLARADGSRKVTLVEHPKGDPTLPGPDFISVAWAPDGTRLAYSGRTIYRGRTVSVLNADGTGERVLDGHWENVSWSPDGARLLLLGWPDAARQDRFDLYTMRPDGTDVVQLTDDPITEHNASWSPDGTAIVFSRAETAAQNVDVDIYVMNADGTNQRRIADSPGFDLLPVWSPDGEWISFASERVEPPERQRATREGDAIADLAIYVMRADGSDVRLVLDLADEVIFPLSWTL